MNVEGRFPAGRFTLLRIRLQVPPNQPQRAELAKMLLHRRARRRSLGSP
ncbi:MAG TPA: hypothetical protein VN177_02710 [Myxococcales bacterium]|nr:hypothetical protein [Myxococcales bacterium]